MLRVSRGGGGGGRGTDDFAFPPPSVRPFVKSVVLSAVKGLEVFVGGKEVQKY